MSTPKTPSQAVVAATAPRGPAEPPQEIDDGTWTDADINHCKSEAKAVADAAAQRTLRAVGADRVGLGGPSPEALERSAYLLCNASRKPLHFCQGYWSKQLIESIKSYAVEFREVSSQAYWTRHDILERAQREGTVDKAKWQTLTDDLRTSTLEMARMHEEITAAFRALIADGIIRPDDFGVFFGLGIHPEVAKLIGGARPLRYRCG